MKCSPGNTFIKLQSNINVLLKILNSGITSMTVTASSPGKNWSSGWRMIKSASVAFFPYLTTLMILFSCQSGTHDLLPDSSGRTGEVVVVMPEESWEGNEGELLRQLLSLPYEMLPQYEPVFNFFNVPPPAFRDFLLMHRNIIMAQINPEEPDTAFDIQYNVRARNQLVITLKAHDYPSFEKLINDEGEKIIAVIEDMERQRLTDGFRANAGNDVMELVRRKHGILMTIPVDYSVVTDTAGFTWIMKETGQVLQGILLYSGHSKDSTIISGAEIIATRDSVLQRFVPGEVEGSYMSTEKEFPPLERRYYLGGKMNVVELRGLWKTESGISMGGPFITISFRIAETMYDTVEGFVYAAGFDKREYMREVEAIVLSAKPD